MLNTVLSKSGALFFMAAVSLLSGACVDSSIPDVIAPTQDELLVRLKADNKAFLVAVGDTFRVSLNAYNAKNEVMDMAKRDSLIFVSSNASKVTVDNSGLLTAVEGTNGQTISVKISFSTRSVTKTEEVLVVVVPARVDVESISIRANDSTQLGSGGFARARVFVSAHDATGQKILNVRAPVYFDHGLPPNTGFFVLLNSAYVPADTSYRYDIINSTGVLDEVWLYSTVNAFGKILKDSIKFKGLYPSASQVTIDQDPELGFLTSTQSGQEFLVQPCALISFTNSSQQTLDVIFDNPSDANGCVTGDETGNIISLAQGGMTIRKFKNTGTITWVVHQSGGPAVTPSVSGKFSMRTVQ